MGRGRARSVSEVFSASDLAVQAMHGRENGSVARRWGGLAFGVWEDVEVDV